MQETVLNGRYRLGEEIGEGGMAVVYRGHDLLLNRQVAIKILRPQYAADSGFLKRFEREAQSAAGFSHPNIVNVYDVGTDANQHYIVMEYIRGPSLKELIRRQGPFSVDGAIFIIGQVASALDYAHQRGLIHRDIKPQNILVDRDGNAKVVDFGIAKGTRDINLTEAGTGMGTVHYVSPEQARGEGASPASDLYSTGIVLYEMLTRRLPFEADTPIGVAMQHVNSPPPPPSQFNPSIPPEVEAIVLRALSKDPRDRYSSGAALAAALRHWDTPVLPRAESGPLPRDMAVAREPRVIRQQPAPTRSRAAQPPAARRRREPARRASDAEYQDDVGCVTWLLGSAILLGIVGLVIIAFKIGPGLFEEDTIVPSTPTLQAEATASTDAQAAGATLTEIAEAPTATEQPSPNAGEPTPTTEGPTPTVVSTPSPESMPVPNLVNADLDQARIAIADRWVLEVSEEFSDTVSAGLIIRQTPPAETPLAVGQTISVVVSSGPQSVDIPDVRGLDAATATAQLEALGLSVRRTDEPSQDFPEGQVIRTEPADQAQAGSEVVLVVSLGDVVAVPNVIEQDVQTARQALIDAGLVVRNVSGLTCEFLQQQNPEFDCTTFPPNGVVSISVDVEAFVPRGTPVDISYFAATQ